MEAQAAERLLHFHLQQSVRPNPYCIAENLPLDIFVDNLSPYLRFNDIMALRRVNKHYFHLTHEPLIWKRFLQQLRIPFPPIRPTFNYSAKSSDYEIEQIVSRTISIEDNLRKNRPVVASTMAFDACLEVFDMKIIPGGKYLVASIGDDQSFFIAVFHLDHPTTPQVLLRYPIQGKVYQLQAKYMKYHDRPVIMIAYVCRVLHKGGSENDPPSEVHVLNCIHVDMNTLDLMADGHRTPARSRVLKKLWPSMDNRFKQVVHTIRQSVRPAVQLSLYSRARVAYISLVQQPYPDMQDCLVIVNVENPQKPWAIFCEPYVYPHDPHRPMNPLPHMKQWIRAVRHVPEQNHVLIWRTIRVSSETDVEEKHVHGIELVALPDQTTAHEHRYFSTTPIHGTLVLLRGEKVQSVHITDDIWPYDEGSKIYQRDNSVPPPPISVFAETSDTRVIHHWHIWPCRGHADGTAPYVYHPHSSTVTAQLRYNAHPYTAHVLPGVYRSLIYTTAQTTTDGDTAPTFVSLHRYISPRFYAPTNRLAHRFRGHGERHDYLGEPCAISASVDLGEDAAAWYAAHGVGVAVWDQTIGRVCLTKGRGSVVHVVDFSHAAPVPDWRFRGGEWNLMDVPVGLGRREAEEQEDEMEMEVEERWSVRKRARTVA